MTLWTFSPILLLLFVAVLFWILLDVRFSEFTPRQKVAIPLIIVALALANNYLLGLLGRKLYGSTILFSEHIPFFLLFSYITGYSKIKMAFMIMSGVVFSSPTVLITSFMRNSFGDSSELILLSNLISYTTVLLLAYFVFRPGIHYLLKYGEDKLFLRFMVIPFIYYIYVYAIQHVTISPANAPAGLVVRLIPTVLVFLFYFLLLFNYRDLSTKRELDITQAALIKELDAAEEQLLLLSNAQMQTAIYQHDMRHHLNAINAFLTTKRYDEATTYIKNVQRDVEAIIPKRFCENEIVNLICSSFSSEAERLGVRMEIKAKLPTDLPLPDRELCTLLSNGLENALNAVFELKDPLKWVTVYCEVKLNKLLIEITNPYVGEVLIRDDLPVASQQNHGYGSKSIKTIVDHYHGLCTFEQNDGLFTLRIVLPLHQAMRSL